MKKTIIAISFLFFTGQIFAQDTRFGNYGFKLGLTASPTLGFGKADNGKGNGVALGLSYGLIGDFNFAENYSFSTGLLVSSINSKITLAQSIPSPNSSTPSTAAADWNYKYKMQYIEIPLTIKLKTGNINGTRWYGQFGLSNGIRISSKVDLEVSQYPAMNLNNSNWSENSNAYRAAMVIGAGGEFNLSGKTSLLLGLTLNNGLTNISSFESEKVKNHYVGINVGVFF